MYLGEITRLVLLSLVDAAPRGLVFDGKSTEAMNAQWGLDSSVMSEIENAWAGEEEEEETGPLVDQGGIPEFSKFEDDERSLSLGVRRRLERVKAIVVRHLGYAEGEVSLRDAAVRVLLLFFDALCSLRCVWKIVRWASALVARRAALLSGVAVAGVMIQTGRATLLGQDAKPPTVGSGDKIIVGVDGR